MSNIKYGLISSVDSACIEKTIDLILSETDETYINVTEVGCYGGDSAAGIAEYIFSKHRLPVITGIDNNKDGETIRFKYDKLIIGNSNEVYNQIKDESQHLIFIDALHTFPAVVSDFFCYAPKVKPGGFLAFHDTGKHLDPLSGWQGVGDKNDPDMCLGGVRKALKSIGLLGIKTIPMSDIGGVVYWEEKIVLSLFPGWVLIFDEADPNDTGGGICVFKKLY